MGDVRWLAIDVELRELRYFVAVAVNLLVHTCLHGSFTAAT